MVWTSNKTPREIGAFMGDDWLASRIAGRCHVIGLEGRDWRLPGRGGRLRVVKASDWSMASRSIAAMMVARCVSDMASVCRGVRPPFPDGNNRT